MNIKCAVFDFDGTLFDSMYVWDRAGEDYLRSLGKEPGPNVREDMRAMSLASEQPTAVLDWNNNYGDEENKVILFHCGPVAQSLMTGKGTVTNHKMFDKTDPGSGWGSNEGRIKAFPTTISNCQTKDGKIIVYASEAEFTDDPIEQAFFGCAGVCEIPNMEDKMIRLARGGFKHHTSVGVGHMKDILKEAFTTYLHYDWVDIDKD